MSAATQWCDDGLHEWLPAVNCITCGRFVGKDGVVEIGYFEMSNEVAYVEGECARCGALSSEDATRPTGDKE